MSIIKRRLIISIILILVILGVTFVVLKKVQGLRKKPEKKSMNQRISVYSAVISKPEDIRMIVTGFGTVVPAKTFSIIPEVSGRAERVSDRFKNGNFVKNGEKIVEIDRQKYDIKYRTQQASIEKLQAELIQLEQEKKNSENSLKIALEEKNIQEREFKRHKNLIKTKSISSTQLDSSNLLYVKSLSALQNIQNTLATLPLKIEILKKQIQIEKIKLEEFSVNLENTLIYSPFDGIVNADTVETNEFVTAGKSIGSIYSIDAVEIPVSFDLKEAMWAMSFKKSSPDDNEFKNFTNITERFGKLEVRIMGIRTDYVWPAQVIRADSQVDPLTRTIRVIAGVKDPFKLVKKSQGPPLKPGVFARVDFSGRVLKECHKLPALAVDGDNRVFVLVPESEVSRKSDKGTGHKETKKQDAYISGTLGIKKVEIARRKDEWVYITKGLLNGEIVLITPIAAPVEGMRIKVQITLLEGGQQ